MKNILFSLILFASLCSCKNKKKNYNLKLVDSIKLPVPSYVSSEGSPATYIYERDDVKNLYTLIRNSDKNQNEVFVYNLNDNTLIKKIVLPYDGPSGFKQITGMAVKNIYSIYLVSYFDTNFTLINQDGGVLNKYSYKHES